MTHSHTVRIEFGSAFDMLDFVQVVSDHIGRMAGLDDDSLHWVSVAVRESVVNAIKHGNQNDESKRVVVEFTPVPAHDPEELVIRVEDEGEGFDPEEIADPLAPENILKSSGRGIFLIRSFMDDVQLQRGKTRGMEVRMVKKVRQERLHSRSRYLSARTTCSSIRRFLATAVEAVVARRRDADGALRLATSASTRRARSISSPRSISRSSACSARSSPSAFPITTCSPKRWGRRERGARHRWVFDPLDGTTNYAHGIPIFCSTLALEIDGVPIGRRGLRSRIGASCSPPSAAWARGSTASRCTSRRADDAHRLGARHRVSLRHSRAGADARDPRAVHRISRRGARRPPARLGGDRSVLGGGGSHGRVLGAGAASRGT